ncbi:hypothetical protein AVEN_55343-1 [Araneus ventricosus]|uniref:Uncharacterized protein n=1 Tax=Araneus ventricosus TaxID=182803 RepID=A0A4Y2DCF0_ARAVE|nr:hypothetical protein AVEN_55343-1 [Araneus ventricosus]
MVWIEVAFHWLSASRDFACSYDIIQKQAKSRDAERPTKFHPRTAVQACLVHVKSFGAKCPPAGVVRKSGKGVSAQVSSSSSELTPH